MLKRDAIPRFNEWEGRRYRFSSRVSRRATNGRQASYLRSAALPFIRTFRNQIDCRRNGTPMRS